MDRGTHNARNPRFAREFLRQKPCPHWQLTSAGEYDKVSSLEMVPPSRAASRTLSTSRGVFILLQEIIEHLARSVNHLYPTARRK